MCWTSADWLLWGGCKSFVPSTCFLRSPVDNLSLCLLSKDVWCLKCQNRTRFPSLAVTVQHDVPPGTPAALWCSVHRLPEPPARPGRSKRNDAVGSECKPLTDGLAYTHVYIYIYWILGCSGHEPNMRFSHGDSHDFIWQRCLFSRLQMGRWAGQQTATIGPIGEVCAANADGTLPLAKWFLQEPIKRIGILSDFLALKFIKVLQCLFEWDLFCYQILDPKFPCSLLGTIHDHPW